MDQYIDSDKLIAEIEKRVVDLDNYKDSFETAAVYQKALAWVKDFILSFQRKQPEVDLEREYKRFINCDNGRSMYDCARHFYELGLNARKEE